MERDVGSLKIELEDLNECVDRETVVDLIHEIVPLLIGKKVRLHAVPSIHPSPLKILIRMR